MASNKTVFFLIGVLLIVLGISMLAPYSMQVIYKENSHSFISSSFVTIFIGILCVLANLEKDLKLNLRQTFLFSTLAWVTVAIFGSLPFLLSSQSFSFSDAFFESMSGITTTGATIIADLDNSPKSILLWRAIMQWLGGIGIVVMAITILPLLKVGGMQLFKTLGKNPPNGFAYELFLDEKGEKISKSKGNGISIEQWLRYASPESLSLYMYPNPKRAKKLYAEVVPKTVDEYLTSVEKFQNQKEKDQILNPVWHVHNGKPPSEKVVIPFSMLLNLVGSSNADNKEILWKFVNRFHQEMKPKDYPILDSLTEYAINYFKDKVEPNKKFKKPSSIEKIALENLIIKLSEIDQSLQPEEIQTIVYATGKENGYEKNLRDWFKLIYEVVFGEENGPRMGYFVSFFGLKETIELMKDKIKNN